jgi:hypothetical protein
MNLFKEDENLDTLDKDELVRRLDKSFDMKLEKVRKILKKDLDQTDLVKLAHCAIEVANQITIVSINISESNGWSFINFIIKGTLKLRDKFNACTA